ncbi:MAG: aspartate kinase [Kordia sp.]|nr:MAG: aspartate kinase [Kordia sp.]
MQVFKFGGASVKNAEGVRNVAKLLQEVGYQDTLVVVSAMGKTTNKLELVVEAYFEEKTKLQEIIQNIIACHEEVLFELFPNKQHLIYKTVTDLFNELTGFLNWNKSPNYSFVYDQVVGYGELISTAIIATYLNEIGIKSNWLDIRSVIKTDNSYRDAKVNWELTKQNVTNHIKKSSLYITQGFLGSDENNFTTTLGREGSDYTAAILAYCLNANNVTIWKDVPGVLNADPRHFNETQLLHQISYEEAIELAFYGASVIHPKTLQPLQRKEIPLYVKSFLNPLDKGTCVSKGKQLEPFVPCFIVKKNQILISLSSLDFSFIVEENISEIFALLHQYKLKVDVIQNSAISFSVCVDDTYKNIEALLQILRSKFKVSCSENVSLYTIRHNNPEAFEKIVKGKEVLLKQEKDNTVQLITSN